MTGEHDPATAQEVDETIAELEEVSDRLRDTITVRFAAAAARAVRQRTLAMEIEPGKRFVEDEHVAGNRTARFPSFADIKVTAAASACF